MKAKPHIETVDERQTRTENALRASELSYRRLFEAAQDGILILDLQQGRISDVNPFLTSLLGFSRREMIGKTVGELSPFKDIEANKIMLGRLQKEGYVAYKDLPLETKDGRKIAVEFVSNVYRAGDKQVIQCNIRDITARKEAEDQKNQLNAQLQQRVAEREEYSHRLQVLSRRVVEAQETERRHLARELHDEIGQALTVAQINLQMLTQSPAVDGMLPRLQESLQVVDRVLEQVHDIALNLRPSMLDDFGLAPALRWLTERQAALIGLRAKFHADTLAHRLDPVIETECFRVAQGALTNVVRHARAKTISVELLTEQGKLHLRVCDDGIGFDVAGLREKAVHGASLGLLSMEERAALAGGGLEFKCAPKQGTEVHAWFPLKWQIPQS